MLKNLKKFLFIFIFCFSLLFLNYISPVNSEPIVGDIILDPEKPPLQSDVTFTVDISDDSISSVRLVLNECNKPMKICHVPPQNVSMSKVGGDTYQAIVTLQWEDVSSITYHIEVISNGNWIEYEEYTTSLKTGSGENSGSNDTNGSPGFEIMVILLAIFSVILLIKKFKVE
jgi:hypothetical protein